MNGLVARGLAAIDPHAVISVPPGPDRCVYLTFDDGPHPEVTPAVLDTLAAENVRATFFVSGEAAERRPDLVLAAARAGHGIANHGYHHRSVESLPAADYVADVERCQRLLEDICGAPVPRLFRPPYGKVGLRTFAALRQRGFRYVLWNVDSRDCVLDSPTALVASVNVRPLPPRCLLLLHDDYEATATALPLVLAALRQRGYSFDELSAVLGMPLALPRDRAEERRWAS